MTVKGNLVHIANRTIYPAEITINQGIIESIEYIHESVNNYILPGFIDAHIHIESSMLVPSEFAKIAVQHGTVATVSDPHEIANVMGVEGVNYMINSGNQVPLKFNFGAPSCVPATPFETAGAELTADDVETLLQRDDIKYLSEMMNWPGVLERDEQVMLKIKAAQANNKPVDGHAPGLTDEDAKRYCSAGISTDHECFSAKEALDKLKLGMKIQIREGSAAKNYKALHPLIDDYFHQMMFCSDDKHPDDLLLGHINKLVARAVKDGHDLFNVLQMACINPIAHYGLDVGSLNSGDPADFIVVEDLEHFNVLQTVIDGETVFSHRQTTFAVEPPKIINQFALKSINQGAFNIPVEGEKVRCIVAQDGELITQSIAAEPAIKNGFWESDINQDILKIAVINRYNKAPVANAFVKNFGLKKGAIASSVAHDSHNIVVVGTNDESMQKAAQLIIDAKGGLSLSYKDENQLLPLPIAGIMSNLPYREVAEQYTQLLKRSKALGCTLTSPYMTMSFLALLVIPELKLSDKGLFDGKTFKFVAQQLT